MGIHRFKFKNFRTGVLYIRSMKTLFTHISKLIGTTAELKFGAEMGRIDAIENAYLLVENGCVVQIGSMGNAPKADIYISLENKEVIPGLVDSHTHTVFAVPREEEFVMRIKGASYEAIAEAGGGILNSARKLRATSEDALFESAKLRVAEMIAQGTTTLEIKSGYGLSVESELKMLRVIKRLKEAFPIVIRATFLGAHAFPEAFKERKDDYVQLIIEDMLPAIVAEDLADHVDVFCESGFFSQTQANMVIQAAIEGLGVALGREPLVIEALRDGRLVRPFPETTKSPFAYWLVRRKEKQERKKIGEFLEWIKFEAQQQPTLPEFRRPNQAV